MKARLVGKNDLKEPRKNPKKIAKKHQPKKSKLFFFVISYFSNKVFNEEILFRPKSSLSVYTISVLRLNRPLDTGRQLQTVSEKLRTTC